MKPMLIVLLTDGAEIVIETGTGYWSSYWDTDVLIQIWFRSSTQNPKNDTLDIGISMFRES